MDFARGGGGSERSGSGDSELDNESTDEDLTGDFDLALFFSSSDSLLLEETLYSGRLCGGTTGEWAGPLLSGREEEEEEGGG